MIDKVLFNKMRNILVLSLAAAFSGIIGVNLINIQYGNSLLLTMAFAVVFVVILYGLVAIHILKSKDSRSLRKVLTRGSIISSVLVIPGIILTVLNITEALVTISIIGLLIFIPFTFYVVLEKHITLINSLLIVGFFIGFLFKRLHYPGASVIISLSCFIIVSGMIIYSFYCFFYSENNKYLRTISSIACILIAYSYLAALFKLNHWPGAEMLISTSYIPMVALTIIVLLTLPNSGFVNWTKSMKELITRKLMMLWIFMLILSSLRFILPQPTFDAIFVDEIGIDYPFNMHDYEVELKEEPSK